MEENKITFDQLEKELHYVLTGLHDGTLKNKEAKELLKVCNKAMKLLTAKAELELKYGRPANA